MNNSKTTAFIVNSDDYFAAHTDTGDLRIGLKGVSAIQFDTTHESAAAVLACTTSEEVEIIFDKTLNTIEATQ